jgi:hypothetical protein
MSADNVVDLGAFKEALASKLKAETEYSEHLDSLLALMELLAPTVRAMRDTNATKNEVATVLRNAADVVDGRVTF